VLHAGVVGPEGQFEAGRGGAQESGVRAGGAEELDQLGVLDPHVRGVGVGRPQHAGADEQVEPVGGAFDPPAAAELPRELQRRAIEDALPVGRARQQDEGPVLHVITVLG